MDDRGGSQKDAVSTILVSSHSLTQSEILIELAKLMVYYLKVHTERVLEKLSGRELSLLKEFREKEETQ